MNPYLPSQGIDVVTDGKFRRRDFRTGFADATRGLAMRTGDMPWHTREGVTTVPGHAWLVTGRLARRTRLTGGEAAHVRSLTAASGQAGRHRDHRR